MGSYFNGINSTASSEALQHDKGKAIWHWENVKKEDIIRAIETALYNKEFKEKFKRCVNPYGDGKASERMVNALSTIKIDKKLLQKKITY